jgi:hypothetical protein
MQELIQKIFPAIKKEIDEGNKNLQEVYELLLEKMLEN